MLRHILRPAALLSLALAALLASPSSADAQSFDDLNGLWTVTLDGKAVKGDALSESYAEIGVRIRLPGKAPVTLTRNGNTLTSVASGDTPGVSGVIAGGDAAKPPKTDVTLDATGLDTKDQADDTLTGTWFGKKAVFKRDTRSRPPIVIRLPGDRPYAAWLREVLIPKSAEDRETYHTFDADEGGKFLKSCQLYRSHYWVSQYMFNSAAFDKVIRGMDGVPVTARRILNSSFGPLLTKNLSKKGKEKAGLAMSSLGMYFSTAAGGSVRIQVAKDATIYYITDRRASSLNGLVVMDTPEHAPLASSFGRWQQSLSSMPLTDDPSFSRLLLETMVKSDTRLAEKLSGVGKSAFTDYLGVMAIEDQRGVMFDGFGQWGYNMTSGSFCALIVRALSHGEMRDGPSHVGGVAPEGKDVKPKKELASQVIVDDWSGDGPTLRPGDCTYFDTLNGADDILTTSGKSGGGDFSEGEGMTKLMELTTAWLLEKHVDQVTRVRDSLKGVIPPAEANSADVKTIANVFHFMCDNFYDQQLRMKNLTKAQGAEVIAAGAALVDTIYKESRDLEAYIVGHGVKKSSEWAPRASGF